MSAITKKKTVKTCLVVLILGTLFVLSMSGKWLGAYNAEYIRNIQSRISSDLSVATNQLQYLGSNMSSRREPLVIFEHADGMIPAAVFEPVSVESQKSEWKRHLSEIISACNVHLPLSDHDNILTCKGKSYTLVEVEKENCGYLFFIGGL